MTRNFHQENDEIQGQKKLYTGEITLGSTTPSYDKETAVDKSFEKADEENRVWYVGVTRTSQNLYIMTAKKEAKGYDIESIQ